MFILSQKKDKAIKIGTVTRQHKERTSILFFSTYEIILQLHKIISDIETPGHDKMQLWGG